MWKLSALCQWRFLEVPKRPPLPPNSPAKYIKEKKVLLRERKRHTARRVASARYVDLSPDRGVPYPADGGGGYPSSPGLGVPHPVLGGTPFQVWTGGTPHPDLGWRYPPSPLQQDGVPPSQVWDGGTPDLSRPGMGSVPPPPIERMGYSPPSPKCEQTENITFPLPSDAGGKKMTAKSGDFLPQRVSGCATANTCKCFLIVSKRHLKNEELAPCKKIVLETYILFCVSTLMRFLFISSTSADVSHFFVLL